ncbi:alpha/beta hydrolase [Limnohabitans sp.]|uniref:alpha/beta fold hydrolase n=1 Tax=Limnohabitans sp. TaxID=1907725 RepID=UPI00286ECBD2|nr:alpha/beta hydrolase [Limnohabitans sp.]
MRPSSHYLQCHGFNIHYTAWGDASLPVVVAWHGLARTGRDFDALAEQLAPHYRVICPDTIGRGLSQWSHAPKDDYSFTTYARITLDLMDALHIAQAHWIGTSMGGALGLICAAALELPALQGRIRSLVLNDIAPEISAAAVARIKAYAGQPPAFDTVPELESFFRQAYAPFGFHTDAQWTHLTETSTRRLPDGRMTPHYDPNITQQFFREVPEYPMWDAYDTLHIPVMVMRGANSDLISTDTIQAMRTRGPGAKGLLQMQEIEGCGHAPALNVPQQWQLVMAFLKSAD